MNKKIALIALLIALILVSGCPQPPEKCGDGNCTASENWKNCPQDCMCGNGKCDAREQANPDLCPEDCPQTTGNCGDGICDAGESPETCPEDCVEPPKELKQVIPEKAVTSGDGRYKRPELIVIGERIFFGFEAGGEKEFRLVELNEDLSYKGQVHKVFAGIDNRTPHDIRLATAGTKLWYAFETVDASARETCQGHSLNIARYDVSGEQPVLEKSKTDIASGCGTTTDDYLNPVGVFPKAPEAVDDPSPIFYNGEYVVLTRGWNNSIQHIRKFDSEFNLLEHILLDLGSATGNKTLSQNALVNIGGRIYIIGGLFYPNNSIDSSIYAIPLSSDLRSVEGEIIPLVKYQNQKFTKVTAARYRDGKLYINYAKAIDRQQYHHLGVFDVEKGFASLAEIQVQDKSVSTNHSSMEVLENRVYFLYQEDETGLIDILGQVFEWQ
ncbi:MAG: hypothetical protein JW744_03950 [Candidatus Diapherotrites archaeon]|uniref:Uncharacterized protein n=1 Tax=Candidatus Iainarchaeum sp. TaxID=3101447 RepID=A0A939C6M0_9ARCH|nr:hypothetical protein [Candidatus Diapherotrites archaeon]